MPPLTTALTQSPELFPQDMDFVRDVLVLIPLSEDAYSKASFLDARVLTASTARRLVPFADVEAAVEESALTERGDFIFHISHVGSTLLSRLIGRHPDVFALREPSLLRLFAQMRAAPQSLPSQWNSAAFEAHLRIVLKLLSRTFHPNQRAMVKATSFVSELAPELLTRKSEPKALFLSVTPESFLATILGAENSPRELQTLVPLRASRLSKQIDAPVEIARMTMGEALAMSWASEVCSLTAALPRSATRIFWLDFDRFLQTPHEALAACFRHFGLAASSEQIAQILSGPDMRTYSKAQQFDYDAQLRQNVLKQARAQFGDEIRQGLNWLDKMAGAHPVIAEGMRIAGKLERVKGIEPSS